MTGLPFSDATATWFLRAFGEPTRVQREGWQAIANGDDALLIAPTGSGKTLAAFLVALDRIGQGVRDATRRAERGWRAIYISPLKALVYDVERNLGTPLRGIEVVAERLGLPFSALTVDVRTGDTPSDVRRKQVDKPGDILVTTPESLYLLLTSEARKNLSTVETLIIDEIHALAPTKRGAHLMLSVERLQALAKTRPQRIGLSATVRPAEEVARFLSASRPCTIVDTAAPPRLDLEVIVPVFDMTRPNLELATAVPEVDPSQRSGPLLVAAAEKGGLGRTPTVDPNLAAMKIGPTQKGLWPAIEPRILELILAHRSTIVFVNSRGLAERLAQSLNELHVALLEAAGETHDGSTLVRSHHGSVAHAQRREIEELLKGGALRAIVATSSLELGIDMGAVDLVIQVESPDSSARGLQRVGRAGHHVGGISRGKIFPKHRGDLLEAAVVSQMMLEGQIESIAIPKNPLDVLAQHLVAMVAVESWSVSAAKTLVKGAYPFTDLTEDVWLATLDMVSGHFPGNDLAELRPRINWNRTTDMLEARKGSRLIATVNGGTIPDRGLYGVFLAGEGDAKKPTRVGELDEEMVHEARVGETFMLGASTWRIAEITRDRVLVTPAPGEPGKMPFWKGEGPGRPIETGRRLGAFTRQLAELVDDEDAADRMLATNTPLDLKARKNLIAHIREQRLATGIVPSDRTIVIERFRDELGDLRVCILTPFGARVHAPWALAIEETLGQKTGQEVQAIYTDDGISLRFADPDPISPPDGGPAKYSSEYFAAQLERQRQARDAKPPGLDELFVEPEDLEDKIIERLSTSAMFSGVFRENAARALLLPRRSPEGRAPLWQQRLRSQSLLGAVRRFPNFPILLETYRTCVKDIFDLPALSTLMRQVTSREVRVVEVDTREASPFSRGLAFAFVASYMYEVDNPVAERRAQALTLDKNLLRELLGHDELRALFSPEVIAELERELQGLVDPYRAAHADQLHDLLRRLGALTRDEIAQRVEDGVDGKTLIAELVEKRRAVFMRVAGTEHLVAIEDCAMYRDALGAVPPNGLPASLLAPVDDALAMLISRYARTHGPFRAEDLARRVALPLTALAPTLTALTRNGRLVEGSFLPSGTGVEYCDAEVLRRLRRRMLAVLRDEVAPVDGPALCRFLMTWQGLHSKARDRRLTEVVAQLEGMALPFSELEATILPTRLASFSPRVLDEACALGEIVWVGRGTLGAKDGRVALYRREQIGRLIAESDIEIASQNANESDTPLHRAILEVLSERGAAFMSDLTIRVGHRLGATTAELTEALWDLVWSGRVTNDTFAPLRSFMLSGNNPIERRGVNRSAGLGGRWSLVADLVRESAAMSPMASNISVATTERSLARVHTLLERWGLVFREVVDLEGLPGGFSAVTPALRVMEDLGKVRRGHFVDGLGSAQFALPGVVDRLRAASDDAARLNCVVLSTMDPANPWGSILPWPGEKKTRGGPRRTVGAKLVLKDGAPLLWVGPRANKLVTFEATREDERLAVEVFAALAEYLEASRERDATIHEVDGQPIRGSRWEVLLREAGFAADYRGMVLAPKVTPKPRPKGYAAPRFDATPQGPTQPARPALTGFIPPTFGPTPRSADTFVPPTSFAPPQEEPPSDVTTETWAEVPTDRFARRFFFRRRRD